MMKTLVRILKMPVRAARVLAALILHPGDEVVGFDVLRKSGRAVFPCYRSRRPQMDWSQDAPFNEYLKRFDELDGLNTDRRWMMYQVARLASSRTWAHTFFAGSSRRARYRREDTSSSTRSKGYRTLLPKMVATGARAISPPTWMQSRQPVGV